MEAKSPNPWVILLAHGCVLIGRPARDDSRLSPERLSPAFELRCEFVESVDSAKRVIGYEYRYRAFPLKFLGVASIAYPEGALPIPLDDLPPKTRELVEGQLALAQTMLDDLRNPRLPAPPTRLVGPDGRAR